MGFCSIQRRKLMKVNLENNATTIVDPQVLHEMKPNFVTKVW